MANLTRLPNPVIENWEWQYEGLCRTLDPEVFFPPDSERGPVRQRREARAKEFCARCPVLEQCRAHALEVQEPYGVWGGLTPRERDRVNRGESPDTAAPSGRSTAGQPAVSGS